RVARLLPGAAARGAAGVTIKESVGKESVGPADRETEKGGWGEIFRDGLGLYSTLVIGGIAMHATQMLVIAIIMPTIVADIGGGALCARGGAPSHVGAIVGASSTGVVWERLGP